MNMLLPIAIAGIGSLCGATAVLVRQGLQSRRDARVRAHREQLKNFCKRAELSFAAVPLRAELDEAVRWFRGSSHDCEAHNVLVGSDRDGSYFVARRRIDGSEHYVLGFEIRGDLDIDRFHLEPVVSADESPKRMGWWKKKRSSAPDLAPPAQLALRWVTGAARFQDPVTRASVTRWFERFAAQYDSARGRVLGLEVHGKRAWVHSTGMLDVGALDAFMKAAMEWRSAVLGEVRMRPATVSREVQTVSSETRARQRAENVDTRPLFPVPVARGIEIEDDGQTIRLSAEALLAELPDRRTTTSIRRKKIFEIPEPEEKVTVLGSY